MVIRNLHIRGLVISSLQSFLAIVEEGSINRAASRLLLSQPTLSRRIQALEHEIGGQLLKRNKDGVVLTDLGRSLAKDMGPVLAGYAEAMEKNKRLARGQERELRVGYIGSAASMYLTPALERFRVSNPETKVMLVDQTPTQQVLALRSNEIDIAMIGQEGHKHSSEFYAQNLVTLGAIVMISQSHALASRETLSLSELKDEVFIGASEVDVPGRNDWNAKLCRKAGYKPRYLRNANGIVNAFALVVSENAVKLAPAYFNPQNAPPGIRFIPVSDTFATWDFLLLWQRGKSPRCTEAFVKVLKENVAELRGNVE